MCIELRYKEYRCNDCWMVPWRSQHSNNLVLSCLFCFFFSLSFYSLSLSLRLAFAFTEKGKLMVAQMTRVLELTGLSVSLISLMISLFIFTYFRWFNLISLIPLHYTHVKLLHLHTLKSKNKSKYWKNNHFFSLSGFLLFVRSFACAYG